MSQQTARNDAIEEIGSLATDGTWSTGRNDSERPIREELLEAVNNRRRRYTLHYLQRYTESEAVDLSDISRQVAAWERGVSPDVISYSERKNVHTSLYQFHAPKLEDFGLVEYDKRSSTIRLTEYGRHLTLSLEIRDATPRIPWYLLVPSGISVVIVTGALLDAPVIGSVPGLAWAALITVMFVLTSAVQIRLDEADGQVVAQHPPDPISEN